MRIFRAGGNAANLPEKSQKLASFGRVVGKVNAITPVLSGAAQAFEAVDEAQKEPEHQRMDCAKAGHKG